MPKPPPSIHWVRENASVRTPYRVLVIDTETLPESADAPDTHVLRLWCAELVRRQDVDPKLPRSERFRGHTAHELAELVDRLARRDRTLWVYAHNLSFDLAVTALPVELVERGWALTEGALTSDSPWCRMSRKGARVTIVDSWSWLPSSVKVIGELVGIDKPDLPAWEDSEDDWYARCEADTAIVATAMGQLMDWWDDGALGVWSVTGPACGWSTYRHQRPAPAVLVDPDPVARALEARGVTGGRRDVRRTGDLPTGLYADLDLSTAHLTVMAGKPLPSRRFRPFDSLPLDSRYLSDDLFDVMAECEVDVTVPRYPWDSGRGVFYPVGRFRTVLAGPELREARSRGELRSIGRGHVYQMSGHMMPWAVWLASIIDKENAAVPNVAKLLAKHWSRCVPGKWAGHTSEVVDRMPDPRPGWHVERGALAPEMRSADFLTIGGECWTIARDMWADDAFPAILAWIQSHTRVAVGRLLDALGTSWISVNTDGALVDVMELLAAERTRHGGIRPGEKRGLHELDAWCQRMDAAIAPFQVRIKGAWSEATVYGPQHMVLGGERKLAGIPRRAVFLADGRYHFTAWPKLHVQLIPDGPPRYRTVDRAIRLDSIPPTGWLLETGRVVPIRLSDGDAEWECAGIQPLGGPGSRDLAPRERQHVSLRPLLPRAATETLGL